MILRMLALVGALVSLAIAPPRAATAAGCGIETPLQDGRYLVNAVDFLEAQRILGQNCIVHREVVVAFPPGVHYQGLVEWRYHRPGQRILFTTTGFETGTGCDAHADQAAMAVFHGSWQHAGALSIVVGGGTTLRDLNFNFHCMKFTRYVQHFISIKAAVNDSNAAELLRGATFDAVVFYLLGNQTLSAPGPGEYGRGAITTGNLSNLEVRNSIFVGLVNQGPYGGDPGPGHVHALYLRRGTVGASVHDNHIESVSGDPFRVTHASNRNLFYRNTVLNSGEQALASDWHNGVDENGQKYMTPSWSNRVYENRYDHVYGRTQAPMAAYCYDLRAACPPDRIQAFGNVRVS